jgi:hypothetical protein
MDETDRPMTPKERLGLAAAIACAGLVMLLCQACEMPADAYAPQPRPCMADPDAKIVVINGGPTASSVYTAQKDIVDAIAKHWDLDIDVIWRPCGEENSYYNPNGPIELCTEMSEHPLAAVYFAAHEAGHAVTHHLTNTLDETSADKIAALELIRADQRAELLGGAIWYKEKAQQGHHRGDPHAGPGFRAWLLSCLEDGSEEHPVSRSCLGLYLSTKMEWDMRLTQPQWGVEDDD